MRAWNFGEPLVSGVWGIREPPAQAAEVEPDILLVPLVAFDRAGRRLGYGGGYYDLTVARLRAHKPVVAMGIAYAIQEIAGVPAAPHDARARSCANRARSHRFARRVSMRILFVGDVVGRSGRTVVTERLPGLIRDWKLDFVAINGENAAGGFGITETIYNEFIEAGADAITLGNHAWDQKEALGLHRTRAASHPADQLSRPARRAAARR